MAKSSNSKKHFSSEESYSSEELTNVVLDDGTKLFTNPVSDIKRPVCAGIDVHKKILVAAVCVTNTADLTAKYYVRKFKSTNSDIKAMAKWMLSYQVKDACMESTGKYWIPVFNLLEQNGIHPVLTHPKYVKQAKGCKTDFRDAVHIANLFRMDLVVASFIPPSEIRDLRELIRYRLKLTYIRTAEKNRFQNSMTISQIRLDNVFSDPFGKSASAIMHYLIYTDPASVSDEEILSLVDPRTKAGHSEILDSIHGYEFIGIQCDKLKVISSHINNINALLDEIDFYLKPFAQKYKPIIDHLSTMIGITPVSALYIISEIGTDMSVWKNADALASWAGLSPANNESGGKKKSTKIGKGGHYLKPLLVQCAFAATKSTTTDPYYRNKYTTIAKRRGKKKAIIAIARKMLVSIYYMIKNDTDFKPVDYDKTIISKQDKPMTINNVIRFLGEHGIDENTIELVKKQFSQKNESETTKEEASETKEKQPSSNTDKSTSEKTARKRTRKPAKSKSSESANNTSPEIASA